MMQALIAGAVLITSSLAAAAEGCAPLGAEVEKAANQVSAGFWDRIASSLSVLADADECKSLADVVKRIKGESGSGKKLEDDATLDVAKGEAQLAEAMADSEIRGRLESVRQEVTDPNVGLLYQAAVLDAYGKNTATKLVLQQLRDKLGKK